ncbi:hypothetical protein ACQEUU_37715 [Nonomuraea sp. CA-218870]|uniref:hypothetical protein n=1 Tax=Nonomuraea sp. CA-218870 TaxID=3239998 RepID=UPI003D9254B6
MSYPTAPVMVWELAGRPRRATLGVTATPGVCAMCARDVEESAPAKKWLEGKSFVDPGHLRARSARVCEACAWSCTGKGMDQVRMWTILTRTDRVLPASHPKAAFAADHVHFTSRADMRAVVDTLADPPAGDWLVCVAESGQKHVLPYAHVNHGPGRWRVRMDALDISATPAEFRHVLAHVVRLREAGFTAEEIEHLAPPVHRLTADTLPVWRHHAGALAPFRAGALIHLVTFLINKEHLSEYLDRYGAAGPADAAGLGQQVRECAAGHAGRHPEPRQERVDAGQDRAGDGHLDGVLF